MFRNYFRAAEVPRLRARDQAARLRGQALRSTQTMATDEKLATFKVVTGTDDGFATSFLEAHGWNVEAAVNSFIGGGGGPGAGGGSSSSNSDKTPPPAPRRGKRPLETEASGNNKKLRV